jgi:ABC-2 type transport system permease protein
MTSFATITGLTFRALLGRRRTLLMLLLAAMPVLLGLLVRANSAELDRSNLGPTLDGFVVRIVLPLIALVFGTASLGSELDDGTAVQILTKPVDRWTIVIAKIFVAGTLTAAMVVPSTVLAGLLMGGLGSESLAITFAYGLATLVGSYVYVAIFLTLSVITSRGLIIGLGYSLVWEGLLGGLMPGTEVFSVREYLSGIASALAPAAAPDSLVGAGGFLYAAVTLGVAAILGAVRLSVYEVRGSD